VYQSFTAYYTVRSRVLEQTKVCPRWACNGSVSMLLLCSAGENHDRCCLFVHIFIFGNFDNYDGLVTVKDSGWCLPHAHSQPAEYCLYSYLIPRTIDNPQASTFSKLTVTAAQRPSHRDPCKTTCSGRESRSNSRRHISKCLSQPLQSPFSTARASHQAPNQQRHQNRGPHASNNCP